MYTPATLYIIIKDLKIIYIQLQSHLIKYMSCFKGSQHKLCISKTRQSKQFPSNKNIKNTIQNKHSMIKSTNTKQILRSDGFIIQCNCTKDQFTGDVIIKQQKNDKLVFIGKLLDGQRSGYGKQFNELQEQIYEGQFLSNKKNGWGRTNNYSGQFKDNVYEGYGRLLIENQFYQGFFTGGLYNGTGIYLKSDEGGFYNKQKIWENYQIDVFIQDMLGKNPKKLFGSQKEDFNIQQIYIGQFTNGDKNGHGKVWKQQGHYWYTGQFSHGMYHGNGTLHTSDGQICKGTFSKGKIKS